MSADGRIAELQGMRGITLYHDQQMNDLCAYLDMGGVRSGFVHGEHNFNRLMEAEQGWVSIAQMDCGDKMAYLVVLRPSAPAPSEQGEQDT